MVDTVNAYAVIKSGGKQYRVAEGNKIKLEKIDGEVGSIVQCQNVLSHFDGKNFHVGKPMLDGVSVEFLDLKRHKKPTLHFIQPLSKTQTQKRYRNETNSVL